jgi:hypothetical protein
LTPKRNFVAYADHLEPTRGGFMSSPVHAISSPASVASTEREARQRNRIDSVTGSCGLYPPTFIRRIGTMAARGDHPLPRHEQTTPTPSRPDRARGPSAGYEWGFGKASGGMVHPGKTPATLIASRPLAERGRVRMEVGRPSRASDRVASRRHHLSRREPMSARAGPPGRCRQLAKLDRLRHLQRRTG